jgi:hypothetical protein
MNVAVILLLVQFAATAAMTGLIWFVQVVHYPLFGKIPEEAFIAYERAHTARTTWVVVPLMLTEIGTAASLPVLDPAFALSPLYLFSLGCLIAIWASTFLIQVPQHAILERQYCPDSIRRLILSNWIRTLLWTVRTGLLFHLVLRGLLPEGLQG